MFKAVNLITCILCILLSGSELVYAAEATKTRQSSILMQNIAKKLKIGQTLCVNNLQVNPQANCIHNVKLPVLIDIMCILLPMSLKKFAVELNVCQLNQII